MMQIMPVAGAAPVVVSAVSFPPPPTAQKMEDNVNIRPIFAPIDRLNGKSQLVHHAFAHEKRDCMNKCRGFMFPVTCLCCPSVNAAERKNFYLQVYDNKVEYNEPAVLCLGSSCELFDNAKVIHFDREVLNEVAKAENCCRPACSHSRMFPDCCGLFGETLVMYRGGGCCGCSGSSRGCCDCGVIYNRRTIHQLGFGSNGSSILIDGIDDANAAAAAIRQARDVRAQTATLTAAGYH